MDDEIPARRPPWLRWLPIGALAVAGIVLLVLVVVTAVSTGHSVASPSTTTPTTATTAVRTTVANSVPASLPVPPTGKDPAKPPLPPPLTPAQKAAEQADLTAEAAHLTGPLSLTSPAAWDRYLPAGKPYPGADTADDISTCPHLADRLTAALGKKMSYWTGTLPMGPSGCTWVPVPLSYDGPYTYAYLLDVGYLADGTTAEQLRTGFYENGPETCPGVDVPAVAPGAVLVRCQQPAELEYDLVLPDPRRPGGIWVLGATARTDAAHTAAEALNDLVAALRPVYG